jgi:hypothetical protein
MLGKSGARLIWTNTKEAYFQLPTGEVMPVYSDDAARYFQRRTERDAFYGSQKWKGAAGALRSWIEEHGQKATVYRQAKVDWQRQVAWVGCEDGCSLYRITPEQLERLPNGADGVLIVRGFAPVLEEIGATGELPRWLEENTWAKPIAKLTMAIYAVMLTLGAEAFDARPLLAAIGFKGSGKTTTLQMLGRAVIGKTPIPQGIKSKEEQNESRLLNEHLVIFDNLDAPPRGYAPEDFLAEACTQQYRSIRALYKEGEVVEKPITAFVAVTSFKVPECLKRQDVIDRQLVCEFERPKGQKVTEMARRAPNRLAVWGDLLDLLQRALRNWPGTPDGSDHRSIEFMRFAHALLQRETAEALEKCLLSLQANTAGLDDPILQKIEAKRPTRPMTASELLDFWWKAKDPARPKSADSLGCKLRNKGVLGPWVVAGKVGTHSNVTLWTFERVEIAAGLPQEGALGHLRGLVAADLRSMSAPCPLPKSAPSPPASSCLAADLADMKHDHLKMEGFGERIEAGKVTERYPAEQTRMSAVGTSQAADMARTWGGHASSSPGDAGAPEATPGRGSAPLPPFSLAAPSRSSSNGENGEVSRDKLRRDEDARNGVWGGAPSTSSLLPPCHDSRAEQAPRTDLELLQELWPEVITEYVEGAGTRELLRDTTPVRIDGDTLVILFPDATTEARFQGAHRQHLAEIIHGMGLHYRMDTDVVPDLAEGDHNYFEDV